MTPKAWGSKLCLLQECEYEISQKGELVAKLENKTREISQMLSNLNKINCPQSPDKRKTEKKQSAKQNTPEEKEEKDQVKDVVDKNAEVRKIVNSETEAKPCDSC